MNTLVWAEIFGFIALVINLCGYQIKRPRVALWVLCFPCLFWIAHFGLLGQISGAFVSLIALARNFGAATLPERYMRGTTAACLFAVCTLTLPSVHAPYELLPLGAALGIGSAVFFRDRPLPFRALCFSGEFCWLAYALYISSAALAVSGVLMMLSVAVSVARHDMPSLRMFLASLAPARPVLQPVPVRVDARAGNQP